MAEKVKVSEKQAGMIENHRGSFETLMSKRIEVGCPTYLDSLSVDQVVEAYFNGYEIERTPEEKALSYYNSFDETPLGEATERIAIRKFLQLAEIEFQGINE